MIAREAEISQRSATTHTAENEPSKPSGKTSSPPTTHYYNSRQVEKFCLDQYDDKLSKEEKAANENIRRDVFKDKEVVQHGRDLMTVSPIRKHDEQ